MSPLSIEQLKSRCRVNPQRFQQGHDVTSSVRSTQGNEETYPNYSNCENTRVKSDVPRLGILTLSSKHTRSSFLEYICLNAAQCNVQEVLKSLNFLFYNAYFYSSLKITLKLDQHRISESYKLPRFPLLLLAHYLQSLSSILRTCINYFIENNFRK